jgi:hypothetical protein
MKYALRGFGSVLMFFGLVLFLQGIGVLPGSFMTGELQWAVYGAISFVAGVLMLVASRRGGGPK